MPDSSTSSGSPRPFDKAQGRPSLSRGGRSRGVTGPNTCVRVLSGSGLVPAGRRRSSRSCRSTWLVAFILKLLRGPVEGAGACVSVALTKTAVSVARVLRH